MNVNIFIMFSPGQIYRIVIGGVVLCLLVTNSTCNIKYSEQNNDPKLSNNFNIDQVWNNHQIAGKMFYNSIADYFQRWNEYWRKYPKVFSNESKNQDLSGIHKKYRFRPKRAVQQPTDTEPQELQPPSESATPPPPAHPLYPALISAPIIPGMFPQGVPQNSPQGIPLAMGDSESQPPSPPHPIGEGTLPSYAQPNPEATFQNVHPDINPFRHPQETPPTTAIDAPDMHQQSAPVNHHLPPYPRTDYPQIPSHPHQQAPGPVPLQQSTNQQDHFKQQPLNKEPVTAPAPARQYPHRSYPQSYRHYPEVPPYPPRPEQQRPYPLQEPYQPHPQQGQYIQQGSHPQRSESQQPQQELYPQYPQQGPHPQYPQQRPHPQYPQQGPHPQHPQQGPHPQYPQQGPHPQHPQQGPYQQGPYQQGPYQQNPYQQQYPQHHSSQDGSPSANQPSSSQRAAWQQRFYEARQKTNVLPTTQVGHTNPIETQPTEQVPVINDPLSGRYYHPGNDHLPPYTDQKPTPNDTHIGTPQPGIYPPGSVHPGSPLPDPHGRTNPGYPPPRYLTPTEAPLPSPTPTPLTEAQQEALEEEDDDRIDLLALLNAQGHNYTALPPEYSTMMHLTEEVDAEDRVDPPVIMPTVTHPPASAHPQGPNAAFNGDHPAYHNSPYWFEGPPYNGMDYYNSNSHPDPYGQHPYRQHPDTSGQHPSSYGQPAVADPYSPHGHKTPPLKISHQIPGINPADHKYAYDQKAPGIYPLTNPQSVHQPGHGIQPTPTQNQHQPTNPNAHPYYYRDHQNKQQQYYQEKHQQAPHNRYPYQHVPPLANDNPRTKPVNRNNVNVQLTNRKAPKVENPKPVNQDKPPVIPPPAGHVEVNTLLSGQAAFLNQQTGDTTTAANGGPEVVISASPSITTTEMVGIVLGTIVGVAIILGPLMCLALKYRKHIKMKRKRFFPRPASQRKDSRNAMDTMVLSELGQDTLPFDSDGSAQNGRGNGPRDHETDRLMSLRVPNVLQTPNMLSASVAFDDDDDNVYSNNIQRKSEDNDQLMSLTSSKRADSLEISRLISLREGVGTDKEIKPETPKRPSLPPRVKTRGIGFPQHFQGSVQMLHKK